jgi:hypothetical protein
LRRLTERLAPGGYLMLGLYSELARADIVELRSIIARAGFPPSVEGIRACRRFVGRYPGDRFRALVDEAADFYSTSMVRDLLTGGDARLVTLVGAGGIGKTRLAIEVGTGLVGTFDGVVMVALDEVTSAELVVSSIASSLGVPESPGQSLVDLVINYLRPRKMLLIIDNFEHVVAAAGVLGQLITETDQVMLLVTSRAVASLR